MRLTCPNCGAQYEVPDAVIPDEGRDVQCSNCGNTWFQGHPAHPDAAAPAPAPAEPDLPNPVAAEHAAEQAGVAAPVTAQDKAPQDQPPEDEKPEVTAPEPDRAEPEDDAIPDAGDDFAGADGFADTDTAADAAGDAGTGTGDLASGTDENRDDGGDTDDLGDGGDNGDDSIADDEARRRQLDPAISQILRKEAEYEAHQRAAETTGNLESQPDLGLDDLPDDESARRSREAREARERMARIRGEGASDTTETTTGPDADIRGNLLPDIDEINSSLRSSGDASGPQNALSSVLNEPQARRSGFTRGFGLVVIVTVILVLLYVNAQKISQSVPQAEPALNAYISLVDRGRVWLDTTVSGFTPQ